MLTFSVSICIDGIGGGCAVSATRSGREKLCFIPELYWLRERPVVLGVADDEDEDGSWATGLVASVIAAGFGVLSLAWLS